MSYRCDGYISDEDSMDILQPPEEVIHADQALYWGFVGRANYCKPGYYRVCKYPHCTHKHDGDGDIDFVMRCRGGMCCQYQGVCKGFHTPLEHFYRLMEISIRNIKSASLRVETLRRMMDHPDGKKNYHNAMKVLCEAREKCEVAKKTYFEAISKENQLL